MPSILKYLAILFPAFSLAQDANEELIAWSPHYKLTWADYKARPETGSDVAATTTTYIGIEYNINASGFSYKIQCRFSKDRSWGLHKTPYILSHEQGHFDIAEIFARKLHKAMRAYRFNQRTYQHDLKTIYEKLMNEKEAMQDEYDRETNHSINREKQAAWLIKIEQYLDDYRDYAAYH